MEPSTSDPNPTPASFSGLRIASLVLGILAVVLSPVILGGILGLAGLGLGLKHLARKEPLATMARWGVGLSTFGVLASIGFLVLYYSAYRQFSKIVQSSSQTEAVDFTKWQGVSAPDISVTTLDGKMIKLSELKGKRVVLDFWATWCPPCREEIPHFIQLYNQTSRDNLVIVGISDEEAKTLTDFVKEQNVSYPIASAKNLPSPYSDVQAIPTTFFIDRKGTIQTVLVGYHQYDDLKQDATGADFAGTPKAAPEGPGPLADASQILNPTVLWSTNIPGAQALCVGDWESDGVPRVLVSAGSTLHVIDLSGVEKSAVPLPESFSLIECGQNKGKGARLLGYGNWAHEVVVVDHAGKKLWGVSSISGVDGAHWGDLNGDGTDELIVGMNGGGGLEAWSADGSKLWSANLGNVWNQAIVPATRDKPARVLATEAGGSVRVFDAKGNPTATLRPNGGYYAQMAVSRATDQTIQIAAINGDQTVAFDETGSVLWTTSAIGNHAGWRSSSFAAGDIKGDGTQDWAFIDGSGNLIIATPNGQRISTIPQAKNLTGFAIATPPGKSGILITLGAGTLQAYTFQP